MLAARATFEPQHEAGEHAPVKNRAAILPNLTFADETSDSWGNASDNAIGAVFSDSVVADCDVCDFLSKFLFWLFLCNFFSVVVSYDQRV